jgi:hypothetical protein
VVVTNQLIGTTGERGKLKFTTIVVKDLFAPDGLLDDCHPTKDVRSQTSSVLGAEYTSL